jgi:hypothetical protein
MKTLIVSLIATGALCAVSSSATASSHRTSQTVDVVAQSSVDVGSRRRHWRHAAHHRIVFAPRRYRYAYGPAIYPRPYYRPYYYSRYAWGPGPYGGYWPRAYGGPWSGYLMGLGYGW